MYSNKFKLICDFDIFTDSEFKFLNGIKSEERATLIESTKPQVFTVLFLVTTFDKLVTL